MMLLRLSVGKDESIRPADLVGAIAGEAKISSSAIGAIKIHDDYSLVEIPDELADEGHHRPAHRQDPRPQGHGSVEATCHG